MPGCLLIEYISSSTGETLSNTWAAQKPQDELRTSFFRSLSRVFLSLARLPLPRIASFVIHGQGALSLTNRPLYLGLQGLENEEILVAIARDDLYSSTNSIVLDSLACHDTRVQHQPNAINDVSDFIYQESTLAATRTIFPRFFRRELRHGPFLFTLTDHHQGNISVDERWNITAPHWFVDKAVDGIDPGEYDGIRREFVEALVAEGGEAQVDGPNLSGLMGRAWDMATFWYSLALSRPTGLFSLFDRMIWPSVTKRCAEQGSFYRS